MPPLEIAILAALGVVAGAAGTIIGAGGGFVVIPMLIFLGVTEPERITAISLAVIFFNSVSGSIAYARLGRIDYRAALAFAGANAPGAIVGALLTYLISGRLYSALFGSILAIVSLFLFLRPNPAVAPHRERPMPGHITHTLIERDGTRHVYSFKAWIGLTINFGIGFFASLMGIGGGILQVPTMAYLLNFPVHIAVATSTFILGIMALTASVVHVANGTIWQNLPFILPLAGGVMVGAQLGARIGKRIRSAWIIRGLAVALAIVAARVLVRVFE